MNRIIRSIPPSLRHGGHYKGQHGKLLVIGGSQLYTGAPYFSGISSLKMGYELVYLFCHPDAMIPIKSYSPELIVCDYTDKVHLKDMIKRIDSVVIGPGLGRNYKDTAWALSLCKKYNKPVVIDADALYLLTQETKTNLKNFITSNCILTPNLIEFARLHDTFVTDI